MSPPPLDGSVFTCYLMVMTKTQKNIRNMTDAELRTALNAARARRDKNPTQTNGYRLNNYIFETHRRGWGE